MAYNGVNEYYTDRGRVRLRHRRGAAPGVPRDPRGRVHPPGRRRGARQHVRPPRPAEPGALPATGRELRVEALNHALAGIPEDRIRYHVCFGSWHVPHVADAPLEAIVDLILQVTPAPTPSRRRTRGTSTSGEVWERTKLPDGQDPHPRRRHPPHDHGRAPAPGRPAHRALRQDRRAGERHRRHRLRLRPGRAHQAPAPEVVWAKFGSLVAGAQIASAANLGFLMSIKRRERSGLLS